MIVLVSDLRLGTGDELEDFLLWGPEPAGPTDRQQAITTLHEHFALFLTLRMHEARARGVRPRLVLLGNTFNLWQAHRRGESLSGALARILHAHHPVIAALGHWCDAGGELDLVIGSHDQPLVDHRAWQLLRDRLPRLNESSGGLPKHSFTDSGSGLYAEYGHRHDPTTRLRSLTNPHAGGSMKQLTRCLLSALEPAEPWIDKALPTAELLFALQQALPVEMRPTDNATLLRGITALAVVRRVIASRRKPTRDGTRERLLTAARSIARGHHKRPLEQLPAALRFVVFGHPAATAEAPLERGVLLMAPASWCPAVRFVDGKPTHVEQHLGYVIVNANDNGGWTASVRHFVDELAVSSTGSSESIRAPETNAHQFPVPTM